MEMRILSELSRWLLSEAALKTQWGRPRWYQVFEACGSPREWADFIKASRSDPILDSLKARYEHIAFEVLNQRVTRPRAPVVLPDF